MANVTLMNVRISYEHLLKPYANDPAAEPKYSATILLDKGDIEGKKRLDAAIAEATEMARIGKWAGVVPPIVPNPVHDGDGVRQDGSAYGPECKGCWVLTASSKQDRPPQVVDRRLNPIIDATQVYSGMYANISLNLFAYVYQGKKGIGCGLGPVQKVADGEPLGGSVATAASVFSDLGEDPNAPSTTFNPFAQ